MTSKTTDTIYRSVELRLQKLQDETKGIRNSRLVRDKRTILMMYGVLLVTTVMRADETLLKVICNDVYNNEVTSKQSQYKNKIPKARLGELKENITFLTNLIKEELKDGSPGTAMMMRKKTYGMPQLKLTCRKTRPPFS